MRQLLEVLQRVMIHGTEMDNRTADPAKSYPGASMVFDMLDGFPAVTTKKLAFKSVIGELRAFYRAATNAADFRALGCKVWDQNANENEAWLANPFREGPDDLGPVYGAQWRQWPGFRLVPHCVGTQAEIERLSAQHSMVRSKGWQPIGDHEGHTVYFKQIDQLLEACHALVTNPTSRRILYHGWNPAVVDQVALPACHVLYQFHANPITLELSMSMYVRSNDLGLGAPFNIAQGAAKLHLIAHMIGYKPRLLNYYVGDAHIYTKHYQMVDEMIHRTPFELPRLTISSNVPTYFEHGEKAWDYLAQLRTEDFILSNYYHHDPIDAPMAV